VSEQAEQEYVLGTHDEEIARLQLQHEVWRLQVLDVWRRAGFAAGQTILDIGCGSGNASLDLAAIVGPAGRVIALDKSRRFLDVLQWRAQAAGFSNISTYQSDLDRDSLPEVVADAAWNRWALSFTARPRDLIAQIAQALRPGGVFVLHEYFDYATWRTAPRSTDIESFVRTVMRTWRESGGEPDLGLVLPRWLDEAGFDVEHARPIIEAAGPSEPKWRWLAAFIESGRRRLESLDAITPGESGAISGALTRLASDPRTRMFTPALLEIIARRR
jgi:ubiquinone/menaquinone biosynthesis C-methylase UbiE